MTRTNVFRVSIVLLSLITLAGLATFIYQYVYGLGITGMSNIVSWSMYIIMFVFFVGLSAGGLIVSSSATIFNIPSFKKVAKPATILSTVCIILAVMFIVVDLGQPQRLLNIMLHPQFSSPMVWDFMVVGIYLCINIAYLILMTRKKTNEKLLKVTSYFALPIAILVHSITAWIFSLQIAREGWFSDVMAPLFVASALDSGLALLLIVLVILTQLKIFQVSKELLTRLAGLLVIFVAVDAYFMIVEIVPTVYLQNESGLMVLNHMLTGSMAPFFWGQIIIGIVVPLAILLFKKNRQTIKMIMLSSSMIVLGVFAKRVWLVLSSYKFPNISSAPGVTSGYYTSGSAQTIHDSTWLSIGQYSPTLPELTIVIGILAFGVLMFMGLTRVILQPRHQDVKS